MITIENVEIKGFRPAIRGMRNPMNSWEKSDSYSTYIEDPETLEKAEYRFFVGDNDEKLMQSLANGGPVHAKYRRMIMVYLDITAPLYWWKEFDTYKVGTVVNSCSTMHKIHAKEFTLEDFSHEHLLTREDVFDADKNIPFEKDPALSATNVNGEQCYYTPKGFLSMTCNVLNRYRELYLQTKNKKYWWQMIQLLPSSYNQKRTVMLSYEVLHNIYISRCDHKLDEWRDFCEFIETLPYSNLITSYVTTMDKE